MRPFRTPCSGPPGRARTSDRWAKVCTEGGRLTCGPSDLSIVGCAEKSRILAPRQCYSSGPRGSVKFHGFRNAQWQVGQVAACGVGSHESLSQDASGSRRAYSVSPRGVSPYPENSSPPVLTRARRTMRSFSKARRVAVSVAGLTFGRERWIGPKRNAPFLPRRVTTHTAHFFPTTSTSPTGGQGHSYSSSERRVMLRRYEAAAYHHFSY